MKAMSGIKIHSIKRIEGNKNDYNNFCLVEHDDF
jgi:hypothetical protein